MPEQQTIVSGRVFCVGDARGDVDTAAHPDHGLYAEDTRHLSRWVLTLDGALPQPLSDQQGSAWARLLLAPPARRHHGPAYTLRRDRHVAADGLVEELTLTSHDREPLTVSLNLAVDTDYADLFEVRGVADPRHRQVTRTADPGGLHLAYRRESSGVGFAVATAVTSTEPTRADATGLHWDVRLPPGGRWTTRVAVGTRAGAPTASEPVTSCAAARDREATELARFSAGVAGRPDGWEGWEGLARCWDQSLRDLAALRVHPPGRPDLDVPAAGLPWFCTLFGRDSLLTSWFALPYLPTLARDTLDGLAGLQGTVVDPAREEEPGKILHELRGGELPTCEDLPYGRYYGTVDATPLFLCLLDAYHRATEDDALVRRLEEHARAAVTWMTDHGDADGDGYLTYAAHNDRGLANHCWKDSPTSVVHRDGTLARGPIAVAEAQGYAYDAYVRIARLAREVWADEAFAAALHERASALRERFARDFWLPDLGYPALALDGDKKPVDALASNVGHLLWSGILPDEQADAVAARLMRPDMFSGWGLRTLAAAETAYHPLEYHCGSVWPHDTAIAAAGLARYGHHDAARALATGLVEAATHLDHRLPEVFAGFDRDETGVPVGYPTACSPQAWAAATPLLLVTCLRAAGTPPG
ncbi:MAG: amylo-alpha-1,6-glucosidase [Actinomycetes bacterium]